MRSQIEQLPDGVWYLAGDGPDVVPEDWADIEQAGAATVAEIDGAGIITNSEPALFVSSTSRLER